MFEFVKFALFYCNFVAALVEARFNSSLFRSLLLNATVTDWLQIGLRLPKLS